MLWERIKTIAIWYFLICAAVLLWRFQFTHNPHAVLDAIVCGFIGTWVVRDKAVRKQPWDEFFAVGSVLITAFILFSWQPVIVESWVLDNVLAAIWMLLIAFSLVMLIAIYADPIGKTVTRFLMWLTEADKSVMPNVHRSTDVDRSADV